MSQHEKTKRSFEQSETNDKKTNNEDANDKLERPLSSEEIMHYVKFCFRADILKQLKHAKQVHKTATELYKKEYGKTIPISVSHSHLTRWMIMNGQLVPK